MSGSESSAVPHPVLSHPIFEVRPLAGWQRLDFEAGTKQSKCHGIVQYRSVAVGNPRYHFPIVIRLYYSVTRKAGEKRVSDAMATGKRVAPWAGRLSEQTPFRQRSTPSARTLTSGTARDSILANFQRPARTSCLWHSDSYRTASQRINSNKLGKGFFPWNEEYVFKMYY